MRPILHIILHFLVPALVARGAFPKRWLRAWLIMVATMIVDLDHLLADPVYAPGRCSIGFHPLHTAGPIALYFALSIGRRTRLVGVGLMIHMALDAIDCFWMGLE